MIDKFLGSLEETVGDEVTIYVISDHGFGPLKGGIYVSRWLKKEGFLVTKKQTLYSKYSRLIKKLLKFKSKIPLHIQDTIRRTIPNFARKVTSSLMYSDIDWERTKAYVVGGGNICINLKGRELKGIVSAGSEYEELRSKIIESLKELEDPTSGEKVIEELYRREDIYHGEFLEDSPDIIVYFKDGYKGLTLNQNGGKNEDNVVVTSEEDKIQMRGLSGTHTMNGIFIGKGKNIKRGIEVQGIKIIDIAPLILYSLSLPIPNDMDGKVPLAIFEDEFLTKNRILYVDSRDLKREIADNQKSEEEKEMIRKRLEGLGYLD
jgi:predicted AlkP superfamily phosphohydrolase/phosphomutase